MKATTNSSKQHENETKNLSQARLIADIKPKIMWPPVKLAKSRIPNVARRMKLEINSTKHKIGLNIKGEPSGAK